MSTKFEEINTLKAEIEAVLKSSPTQEQLDANTPKFARIELLTKEIEQEKKLAEVQLINSQEFTKKITDIKGGNMENTNTKVDEYSKAKDEINTFLRTGKTDEFTIITTSGSSVLLPSIPTAPYITRKPKNAFRLALQAYGLIPITTVGTENVPVPIFDYSGVEGNSPAEGATSENTGDPTMTGVVLGSTLTSSKSTWLSNTTIAANSFDVLGFVSPVLANQVDHYQQATWAAAIVADSAIVGKTSASPTAVTYSEVLDWYYSLPVQYRDDAAFVISDGLSRALAGLVDSNNRPFFLTNLAGDIPNTLFGKPCFICDSFGTLAATNVVGAVFSASSFFIRDVSEKRLTRYVSVPSRPDQTGLELFVNGDAKYAPKAIKTLVMHAAT